MTKLIFILLVTMFTIGCRNGAGTTETPTEDSTKIVLDTIPADTTGQDTLLLND